MNAPISGWDDINQADCFGQAPVFAACEKGHLEVALILRMDGIDINQAETDGYTPLFVACEKLLEL